MANLVELYDLVIQAQALNGVPLSHGHVYVYALGRTKLMDTWSDIDGESLNPNPVILDNAGQAHIYVSDDFDYTLVFTDEFDNEIFSVDKYLLSKGEHSHADVAVAPSEHIGVSSYHVGEVTVYVPYLTGEVGKVYEGIDPIVVNNDVNRISANHIPLGVQEPLYFVEDSETACIIGCSAQTEIPSALSSKWDEASDAVIANSAQWAEGTEYEAGSYVDIDGHTISITGLQPEGDYAYNSALSSKLDITALPQDLVHSGDLTAYYPSDNPSGFITGVDLTDYATTAQLDEKLDKSDSGNFYPMEGNPSGFLTAHQSLQGYATEQWVEDKGYITGVDIPESATWNATTETVSSNSAQWGASNPQIPVTGINGIKISESGDKVVFEVSGDYYPGNNPSGFITGVDLTDYATTAQVAEKQDSLTFGYKDTAISSIDNSALYDNSAHARITTLAGRISDLSSNKLDTTAFSDVSGTFLTAHQDLSDYQTTAGMTAYQPVGDYMTTADSANFYTTANESGFISEVPAGTMNESAFSYDASDNITAYNGSAFKAGDEFPQSATEAIETVTANSAYWNGTTDTVSSNSGSWGGEALPLSSRDGIDLEIAGDMLYIGASALTASIDEKLDATVYAADSGSFLTAHQSLDSYLQNTDLEISDNKITGISGVPLAAGGGGDVPEGVMAESGLEFNAVDEISGYNGSAFAQYGAEKQWLVHDDTLVHASNSAQYALGVNLSAVAQLLGVDETEILASTSTSAFTLSEPVSSFKKLEIKVNWWSKNPNCYYPVQIFDTGNIRVAGVLTDVASDGSPLEVFSFSWSSTNGLNYNLARAFAKFADVNGWGGDTATPDVLSVRGIGRKQ